MRAVLRYVVLTAARDWLLPGLLAAVAVCYGLAVFTGGASLAEQSAAASVTFAGGARACLSFGMIVFVCFHVRRAFDNREVEAFLSKPLSRSAFVISSWLGYASLACLPVLFAGGGLLLMKTQPIGVALWCMSVLCEVWIVTAFALTCALILSGAFAAVLSASLFYVVARLLGFFVAVIEEKAAVYGHGRLTDANGLLEYTLTHLSMLLPRLDLYGRTGPLVYPQDGLPASWYFFVLQTLVYVPLLLTMAQIDFKRKQF